jgi:glycosyltransferase involved in cell wall biosynthesis
MRVLHIVGGDIDGGAGKGALNLHLALLEKGIQSVILRQGNAKTAHPQVHSLSSTPYAFIKTMVLSYLDQLPVYLYFKHNRKQRFSPFFFGRDLTRHPLYHQADLIHLHWVNKGMLSFHSLQKIKKPVVWTLRDMGLFTGGCHYSFSCDKYQTHCGACPVLKRGTLKDLSFKVHEMKLQLLPSHINFVAISAWLKRCAESSRLLKNLPINLIWNGVDAKSFRCNDKASARTLLGLPQGKKIVCIGAIDLDSPYKGFRSAREFFDRLRKSPDIYIVSFGKGNLDFLPANYRSFGYVRDEGQLNLIYASADVFVSLSTEEAFGKTLVEAMMSGTPVLCYDRGGPAEIVVHREDGYRAHFLDAEDLLTGLDFCLANAEQLGKAAVRNAVSKFDTAVVSSQYIELYTKILKSNASQTHPALS